MSRSNVFVAQKGNSKAAMALSSLARALFELEALAVARFVAKNGSTPLLLLLAPAIEPGCEGLTDVELPFLEDLRDYRFPPLDRLLTVSGKAVTQHRTLPEPALQQAMGAFIDKMDLGGEQGY